MADDGKGTRGYTLMEAVTDATDMWYNELKNFNFEDYQSHRGVVRHFTQVKMKYGAGTLRCFKNTLIAYPRETNLIHILFVIISNYLMYSLYQNRTYMISLYGKNQVNLGSVLLPVLLILMYVLDIEPMEIPHRMFQDALAGFFPSPNGPVTQRQATKQQLSL